MTFKNDCFFLPKLRRAALTLKFSTSFVASLATALLISLLSFPADAHLWRSLARSDGTQVWVNSNPHEFMVKVFVAHPTSPYYPKFCLGENRSVLVFQLHSQKLALQLRDFLRVKMSSFSFKAHHTELAVLSPNDSLEELTQALHTIVSDFKLPSEISSEPQHIEIGRLSEGTTPSLGDLKNEKSAALSSIFESLDDGVIRKTLSYLPNRVLVNKKHQLKEGELVLRFKQKSSAPLGKVEALSKESKLAVKKVVFSTDYDKAHEHLVTVLPNITHWKKGANYSNRGYELFDHLQSMDAQGFSNQRLELMREKPRFAPNIYSQRNLALFELSLAYHAGDVLAVKEKLKMLSEHGDPESALYLALLYLHDPFGLPIHNRKLDELLVLPHWPEVVASAIPKDIEAAKFYLELASSLGYSPAKRILAEVCLGKDFDSKGSASETLTHLQSVPPVSRGTREQVIQLLKGMPPHASEYLLFKLHANSPGSEISAIEHLSASASRGDLSAKSFLGQLLVSGFHSDRIVIPERRKLGLKYLHDVIKEAKRIPKRSKKNS